VPDPSDGRAGITAGLVRALVSEQFPRWADLPVTPVENDGWDNRTYRLGDTMTVRLPTHARYATAVGKEDRWLPVLGPRLPVPIPIPLATGAPGPGYPYRWSVRRWLPGETATIARIRSVPEFGIALAQFLVALQAIDAREGPAAGVHSFHRGGSLEHYDDETRRSAAALRDVVDTRRVLRVWEAALATRWKGEAVWVHGDLAVGNLLVRHGELAAVIDFGTCAVGDPACDLVIAWTFLSGSSRISFQQAVAQDDDVWARARGWALWKSLISLAGDDIGPAAAHHRHVIDQVLADAFRS
jgi:aminoglycoside phosphotransferase (APT) family kinase protein